MYKVHPSIKGDHITTINDLPVVIGENPKSYKKEIIRDGVLVSVEAKPATQEQLKIIHERGDKTQDGHHVVIKVITPAKETK